MGYYEINEEEKKGDSPFPIELCSVRTTKAAVDSVDDPQELLELVMAGAKGNLGDLDEIGGAGSTDTIINEGFPAGRIAAMFRLEDVTICVTYERQSNGEWLASVMTSDETENILGKGGLR